MAPSSPPRSRSVRWCSRTSPARMPSCASSASARSSSRNAPSQKGASLTRSGRSAQGREGRFAELSARLVEVQEGERRQLSTELHDRTSPQLAAIQINLRMLANQLQDRETEDIGALLDDTVHLLADTTATIRDVSSDLRPAVLDDGGLLPALDAYTQQFTQRTGIQVQLDTREATRPLARALQSSLFRIVQEALTNCVKHARARNIAIRLSSAHAP